MYRKLYWVVEEPEEEGFRVTGVYTSVYDLLEGGLIDRHSRLSLHPLDKRDSPVAKYRTVEELTSDLSRLHSEQYLRDEEVRMFQDGLSKL